MRARFFNQLLVFFASAAVTTALAEPPAAGPPAAGSPAAGSPSVLLQALDAAWRRSPQARGLEARREEALAGQEAAQAWTAGAPSLGILQRGDQWTSRRGVRETEVSVSAPVWLPGQKAARRTLADSQANELEAQIAAARLTLAGEVRERIWALAAARETVLEALDHQAHLEELAAEVMRRVQAGDLAHTDGLLARQEVLAARNAVSTAQFRQQEALLRLRTLTGLPDIALPEPEPLATAMREPHPRLAATRAALQQAQAARDVVDRSRSDPPTVGLAVRRDAGDAATASSHTLGIAVQIPIGTRARNRPLETAAQTRIDTATADAALAEASLQAEADQARVHLDIAREALDAATARAALTREHTRYIAKAFRLGERGLAELLRSQALSHEAEATERQLRVALGLAHARLNQALGILP
jgi:outer membrane protein TolC